MANSAFQLKGRKSMRALGRFTMNTVLGLGGLFDVASKMGMPKPYEDFGLTLAHYGVGKIDIYNRMELFSTSSVPVTALRGIDMRKNIDFHYYQTNSPFEYEYVRYLYGKYRGIQEAASEK